MAAVTADDEGGADVNWAGRSVGVNADDPIIAVFDEAGCLMLHEEVKGGEFRGLGSEEVEEVPLGHERDELGVRWKVGEVGYGE